MSDSVNTAPILESARTQASVSRRPIAGSATVPAAPKAALKVCIIGLKCYDHIAEKPVPKYLGGVETQLAVLARGLRLVIR